MKVNARNVWFTGGKYSRRPKMNRGRPNGGVAYMFPALYAYQEPIHCEDNCGSGYWNSSVKG